MLSQHHSRSGWWGDRSSKSPLGGLILELSCSALPEVAQLSAYDLAAVIESADDNWVLRRGVELSGNRLPSGARLLQRASLALIEHLSDVRPPAAVVFERTPPPNAERNEYPIRAIDALMRVVAAE